MKGSNSHLEAFSKNYYQIHDNIILYYKCTLNIIVNYLLLDYNNRHNSQYTTQFTIIQKDFNRLLLKRFQLLVNN